jgi:hypothetical protein
MDYGRSRMAGAGIKREGKASLGVQVSDQTRAEGSGYSEEAAMWQAWNTVPTRWPHLRRVMVVSVGLFVSACTAPSRSGSAPAALPPEGGHAGSGNGRGGY